MNNKPILIVNQPGKNQGDEAAMIAMFRDKTLGIPFEQKVRLKENNNCHWLINFQEKTSITMKEISMVMKDNYCNKDV